MINQNINKIVAIIIMARVIKLIGYIFAIITTAILLVYIAMPLNIKTANTQAKIMVPAYFYPGVDGNGNGMDDWQDMADAAKTVGIIAIMNPSSGSGTAINHDYVNAVSKLHANGGLVIGYLSTDWGKRPIDALKKEAQNYIDWYGVNGFFFDEMPTTFTMDSQPQGQRDAIFKFYADLYSFIQTFPKHNYVIGNPGNLTLESFLSKPTANALVTLENDHKIESIAGSSPINAKTYIPSAWQISRPHNRSQFALIQHNVATATDMQAVVNAGMEKGFGLFYVTDDTNANYNPFDRLPKYWNDFVAKIKSVSQ